MAVTTPMLYNGMYIDRNMTEEQAELILNTRQIKGIPNLKNMLFNFPLDLIRDSIENECSVRELIEERGLDINNYIGELRDYQTVGTAFMYMSPRSIIADGCGLGKTAEVAALINWLKKRNEMKRFVIAVENGAFIQTRIELIKFTGLNIVSLPGEAAKIKKIINNTNWNKVDGIVIKHTTLRSDSFSKWLAINLDENGMCRIFDTLFLDESSVIKNDTSKIFKYTKNICDIVTRVHLMNATAFETSIIDIYNQIEMMNNTLLPKRWRIDKEYCTFNRSSYWTKDHTGKAKMNFRHERSGYKNQDKFKKSLQLVYFGRSSADVGKDLPHIHKVYKVEPSNNMSLALAKGYRYSEVLNCPSLIPEIGIEMSRASVPKLNRLCELVEREFINNKIMIYCFHLDAQDAIKREMEALGKKCTILNGATNDDEKLDIQYSFNSGDCDVIVTNLKKSLNLQGGEVCIFYSMETNPSKAFQIASRIDRHVDDTIKTFILLLYEGTDEYRFFTTTVKQRAKDARDLTIDTKTTVDFFYDALLEDELGDLKKTKRKK